MTLYWWVHSKQQELTSQVTPSGQTHQPFIALLVEVQMHLSLWQHCHMSAPQSLHLTKGTGVQHKQSKAPSVLLMTGRGTLKEKLHELKGVSLGAHWSLPWSLCTLQTSWHHPHTLILYCPNSSTTVGPILKISKKCILLCHTELWG